MYKDSFILNFAKNKEIMEWNNPFFRVAAVVPKVQPGDIGFNVTSILQMVRKMDEMKVHLAVFPELCLTGYTCGDLFQTDTIIDETIVALETLCRETTYTTTAFIVGGPYRRGNNLYNCAFLIHGGAVRMRIPKRNIPNYNEFYEKRWFVPGEEKIRQLYSINGVNIGIEICEDLWVSEPESIRLASGGADIIANLSASDDLTGKYDYLLNLLRHQSGSSICGYVYSSAGFGESSTDLVFDGKAIIAENGKIMAKNRRWQNGPTFAVADLDIESLRHDRMVKGNFKNVPESDIEIIESGITVPKRKTVAFFRDIEQLPFVPSSDSKRNERCEEIFNIQTAGLSRRLDFAKCESLVVGISGGLDSTLALLVGCSAFDRLGYDRKKITAVTMPGFGTSTRTKGNAKELCELLGVGFREISIVEAVNLHFKEIGHDASVKDVTYENSQARQRTMILMNLANQTGGMVLGTGDMSELALGWATYNGDHMSMYNVNCGIPKTLVRYLVQWRAEKEKPESRLRKVLEDIVATPVSPELLPPSVDGTISQVTEDLVGPYELHDFFLYHFLRFGSKPEKIFILALRAFKDKYNAKEILKWMNIFFRRFFAQQFKRSCMPDGPKIGSVCLSPRGDWRMPSDASSKIWLEEIARLTMENT